MSEIGIVVYNHIARVVSDGGVATHIHVCKLFTNDGVELFMFVYRCLNGGVESPNFDSVVGLCMENESKLTPC